MAETQQISIISDGHFDRAFTKLAREKVRLATEILDVLSSFETGSLPLGARVLTNAENGEVFLIPVRGYQIAVLRTEDRLILLDLIKNGHRKPREIMDQVVRAMIDDGANTDTDQDFVQ